MVVVASPATPTLVAIPVVALPSPDPDISDVLVAIPAYNEGRFIGSLVHEVVLQGFPCLVIDDGSSDRTTAIASAAGAMVERHERNKGKAAALNTAFEFARRTNVSTLVVMDGDWQHDPHEIADLLGPIQAGKADIVSGSRFLSTARGRVPAVRRVGMQALTIGSSIASGQSMTDSLSGFRAFGRDAIEALRFKSQGFSVEFEMQFMAREDGLKIMELPITARYDEPAPRNVFVYGLRLVDGLIQLTARFRPWLFFGLPSVIALLIGIGLGAAVIATYQRTAELAVGDMLLMGLLTILGAIGIFTAILLQVLRGLFLDLEGQIKALATLTRGQPTLAKTRQAYRRGTAESALGSQEGHPLP
jgi:glycosyltransferase involved in cell wall biosynthesis